MVGSVDANARFSGAWVETLHDTFSIFSLWSPFVNFFIQFSLDLRCVSQLTTIKGIVKLMFHFGTGKDIFCQDRKSNFIAEIV